MNLHYLARFAIFFAISFSALTSAEAGQKVSIDKDWKFAFGHTDPARDFGAGTEYFNYLTKAASIHNEGPYSAKFDDSTWVSVNLPHDFVVDLPYAPRGIAQPRL